MDHAFLNLTQCDVYSFNCYVTPEPDKMQGLLSVRTPLTISPLLKITPLTNSP